MTRTNARNINMTDERKAAIRNEYKALCACSKSYLAEQYQMSHRVCDTRELSKGSLVTEVMNDRYGAGWAVALAK